MWKVSESGDDSIFAHRIILNDREYTENNYRSVIPSDIE